MPSVMLRQPPSAPSRPRPCAPVPRGRAHASGPTLRSGRNSGDTLVVRAVPEGRKGAPGGAKDGGSVNRALILSTLGINYTTNPQWAKAVFDAADQRSVDVVFENVGAATWKDSIGSLKGGGRLVTCGSPSGPVGETLVPLVFWKPVHIIGSTIGQPARVQQRDATVLRGPAQGRSPTRWSRSRTARRRRRGWPRASSSARSCSRPRDP